MGDGVRLAIAIAFLFAAGVAFFFAFHPYGVNGGNIDDADSAIGWLIREFQATAGDTAGVDLSDAGGSGKATPTIDVNQPGAIPGVTPAAQPGVTAPGFLPGGQIPGVNAEPTGPST